MSGANQIDMFLVPSRSVLDAVRATHESLEREGLQLLEDQSLERATLTESSTDLAYLQYGLTSFVVRVSWRGDPKSEWVKVVSIRFTDSLDRHGGLPAVERLVALARRLHADIKACRTVWGWDLDQSSQYRWRDEWSRLHRGIIEGHYWLDIVSADLVEPQTLSQLTTGSEREIVHNGTLFIRRSAWPR